MRSFTFILDTIARHASGPVFIFTICGTAFFFTVYLLFPQFRYGGRALRLLAGKEKDTPSAKGGEGSASLLQTLATSLGGSIGMGSITGVALAVHIGGPGSIFWMWVLAALGMALRLAEVIICHSSREKGEDGAMYGGPMYYMKKLFEITQGGCFLCFVCFVRCFLCSQFHPRQQSSKGAKLQLWYTKNGNRYCYRVAFGGGDYWWYQTHSHSSRTTHSLHDHNLRRPNSLYTVSLLGKIAQHFLSHNHECL